MIGNTLPHIVVITAPERLEQDWIQRLSNEASFGRVDRAGVVQAGLDLVRQTNPALVIVDRDFEQAEACVRQIFTTMPTTICIAIVPKPDVAALRRLVAAGARDVLVRAAFEYNELLESVRSLVAAEQDRRTRAQAGPGEGRSSSRGRLVVVFSPKGGSGTTTIATNLAVALRQMGAGRVVLADFSFQFGDVGVQLNIWSKYTIQDLLPRVDEIDDAMLAPVLQQHSSGIQVLLAPTTPDGAGEVTVDQLNVVLDRLLERNSYVVVDTWSFLDDVAGTLLRRADEVLVVATPEVPALRSVKQFLEFIRQQGLISGRLTLVLNRFPSVNNIWLEDVQQHLRHQVGANIPSEGRLITHSINRGVPIVISHPQSWVGQCMIKLAAHIAGDAIDPISLAPDKNQLKHMSQPEDKGRRNFFRFVRREA
ncbi:MAG TPA: AAA family ATPase [Kouleothrix sp.]|mgnify:CR=1 FL=1|uniref:AAA family ATPase n=1 Tax=Kouleothrix sp. TaxID=2779161 RepID=UPI002C100F7D|nr:AAA family ATPase [Kouleothrix sp.]